MAQDHLLITSIDVGSYALGLSWMHPTPSAQIGDVLLCLARQGRMADGDTPEIASATLYVPGEHVADAAVQGVAVGEPVARQPSDKAESARFQPPPEDSVAGEPAEGVLYSALSAKFFARFDLDRDGEIDVDELRSALKQLELDDVDAAAAMSTFDTNGDNKIQFKEWEAGLDARTRAAIEAHVDDPAQTS